MKHEIENQKCLSINRLKPRSTVIPADKPGVYYANKQQSKNIILLNGEYSFTYDGKPSGTIDVPSMWQYRGFGTLRYTNTVYPFPLNPPYVGNYNPVGEYERGFEIDDLTKRYILHFEGVDNAFYVYINGELAGFSKGSHLPAEFDITSLLRSGENTLSVKVYTYSDSSYLECQDMIWANGIFRDVYLIRTEKTTLWDYRVKTDLSSVSVKLEVEGAEAADTAVRVTLDGVVQEKSCTGKPVELYFEMKSARLWNAEEPNLYDMTIELLVNGTVTEIHSKKIGLCSSYIDYSNGIFMVNGSPVRLKGVNRHEYTPDNGRAITYDQTKLELILLKRKNFNAVRCSHYPNNPYFYELCSEIGLYVMDEADLETHGMQNAGDQGILSKDPEWAEAYLDRTVRMYERDKNEVCIVIWSCGNEAGFGENIVKCLDYLKACEVKKPVLYPQDSGKTPSNVDFCQCGYMPLWVLDESDWYQQAAKRAGRTYPVEFTEYAHMMGNAPGLLYDYWKYVYHHPTFAGGFIWEFKNHGIKKGDTYLYGGDFGEYNHAYNFCLDGMFLSNLTPKPGFFEAAEVLAPIWLDSDEKGIYIINTNDFRSLDYLEIEWELLEDYNVIRSGELKLDTEPRGRYNFEAPEYLPIPGRRYYLNVLAYDKGRPISKKQLELPRSTIKTEPLKKRAFSYEINGNRLTADGFSVDFKDGMLSYYELNGRVLINERVRPCLYRKPTDNDGIAGKHERIISMWNAAFLKEYDFYPVKSEIKTKKNEVIFKFTGLLCAEGVYAGFNTEIAYHILAGGTIITDITAKPYGKIPEALPRIGLCIPTSREFSEVEWYGRGEEENYHDRKHSAPIGLYSKNVCDMSFEYDRPQENGNRCDNRFVNLTDGKDGITVFGIEEFDFSVHDYSLDELIAAEHRGELKKSDKNYLYIDYKTRGLGNASCGSEPEKQHELSPHAFRFVFGICGFKSTEESLAAVRRSYGIKTERLSEEYVYEPGAVQRQRFDSAD